MRGGKRADRPWELLFPDVNPLFKLLLALVVLVVVDDEVVVGAGVPTVIVTV